jgi:hypothetical protein
MAFPTSIDGSISFRNEGAAHADAEIVAVRIEEILASGPTRDIVRHGASISFGVRFPIMRITWNCLVAVTGGTVDVTTGPSDITIAYTLRMTHLVIVVTLMLAVLIAVVASNNHLPADFIPFVPIAWLWIVGGNYLMTKIRFRGWLERQLRKKPLFGRSSAA